MQPSMYSKSLHFLLEKGFLKYSDSILVLAGGAYDKQSMLDANLKNVTISNLDYHDGYNGYTDYAPYQWKRIDAECISENDNSYDWVIIHAGLHHLAIPALGVCEMFRVARKGILCIEARDNFLMKLAVKLGLTSDFELEAVFVSDGSFGGYRWGPIPNYVYRWTEREFEKTVNSFVPTHNHDFFYIYDIRLPVERYAMSKNFLMPIILWTLLRLKNVFKLLFPKQGNQFAFIALKNLSLKPWLTSDLNFDETFLAQKYDKTKYPGCRKNEN
jgi:hypothetical protein